MTPSISVQDLAAQWISARSLYPIYFELAREFAIDVKTCAELEAGVEAPGKEAVEQARQWLEQMDSQLQVQQLRQFLQTNALVTQETLLYLVQHFVAKSEKSDKVRDKVDFLLVQYFSQIAPTGINDSEVDLAYVARAIEPVLGQIDLKPPVWLNALDRVLDAARKCRSLDELLHGGVLEQGRKAKGLAGDLFYLPVALTAFTRFGYLMRRSFFRLMLGDLNTILDGLTELEDKGVETIDCRRAQFSAQEPIIRLRMICQSWKVMFQAEYSSGQPLRMLVDLRASVEYALGRGKAPQPDAKAAKAKPASPAAKTAVAVRTTTATKVTAAAAPVSAAKPVSKPVGTPAAVAPKPAAMAATAGASKSGTKAGVALSATAKPLAKTAAKPAAKAAAPEFEVSATPGWDSDPAEDTADKK